ncbi:hypothetical protein MBAV_005946 [Candidatus Magnetobacterium bavaricum]|uniref:Uncharacterized protein n=1 Tax=Candidatus Magnetobacterium bavaricum TaxID=29290 RepID=A0A0F3GJ03_9BACT|nr:hypothetical protein MBAV_005946 [Candidatus Magnetobacterium bavaricum]
MVYTQLYHKAVRVITHPLTNHTRSCHSRGACNKSVGTATVLKSGFVVFKELIRAETPRIARYVAAPTEQTQSLGVFCADSVKSVGGVA